MQAILYQWLTQVSLVVLFTLGLLLGVWLGFRMQGGDIKKGPLEPLLKPKKKKPFDAAQMKDYISDAFDLDEEVEAIPIGKRE